MHDNHTLACQVLRHLAGLGVREVCVAAGARNAPLVAPLLASRGVKVWNFFDERSAAFFALGRMMAERKPVAVLTTSGTAVAELLPAVIEAHYQGRPLVMVTADRPKRFRGSGAPQAIEQVGIFGQYAEPTLDLDADSELENWPLRLGRKPVHVNVCFDEPLQCVSQGIDFHAVDTTGDLDRSRVPGISGPMNPNEAALAVLNDWLGKREGMVVLAGGLHMDQVPKVVEFLQSVNAPIVAEATANLSGHAKLRDLLIVGGERALQRLNPKRVLRIGSVPSWRWWRDLEHRPEVQVLNVSDSSFPGLARKENVITANWLILNQAIEHCAVAAGSFGNSPIGGLADRLGALCRQLPLAEVSWMRHLSVAMPAGARVFLGNSLPIREWNLAAAPPRPGTAFFANRGANGIDGTVSTFLGVGAGSRESWLITGDLSALYDLSAPWMLPQLPEGNRRIVVINNGGGRIFSRVESLRSLDDAAREVIENRHGYSFEPWARMWELDYVTCKSPEHLGEVPAGNAVIEIRPDPSQTETFWRQWSEG